jgi:hypothetical protein
MLPNKIASEVVQCLGTLWSFPMKLEVVGIKWSKKLHSIPTFFHIYSILTMLSMALKRWDKGGPCRNI